MTPLLQPPKTMFSLTDAELKSAAKAAADQIRSVAGSNAAEPAPTGGGSRQRGLPEDLRKKIVDVRAALYQRGIFDPVLVRFDTASAPQASTLTIADALVAATEAL